VLRGFGACRLRRLRTASPPSAARAPTPAHAAWRLYFRSLIFKFPYFEIIAKKIMSLTKEQVAQRVKTTLYAFPVGFLLFMVHHSFLENMRYGIHRRRLKPAAIYG
jgi:hypothetical protein